MPTLIGSSDIDDHIISKKWKDPKAVDRRHTRKANDDSEDDDSSDLEDDIINGMWNNLADGNRPPKMEGGDPLQQQHQQQQPASSSMMAAPPTTCYRGTRSSPTRAVAGLEGHSRSVEAGARTSLHEPTTKPKHVPRHYMFLDALRFWKARAGEDEQGGTRSIARRLIQEGSGGTTGRLLVSVHLIALLPSSSASRSFLY